MPKSLEGRTVLITGGAGLVGSHLVDQLIGRNLQEIRVLDNLSRGTWRNLAQAETLRPITRIEADLRDRSAVQRAVAGCDYLFHLAAVTPTRCAEHPREGVEVLINGTFNVFEAAVAARVDKVVYASSAAVYGEADQFPTDEGQHPYNGRTLFGAAKLLNEGLARSFRQMYGLASVGLRYFTVYGPRMDEAGACADGLMGWLDGIERGEAPRIADSGTPTRDFVHVEDAARAALLALRSPQTEGVYNVASGVETSLARLWHVLQQVTGAYHLAPEFLPAGKGGPVTRCRGNPSRAKQDLGFVTELSLEEGLRRLACWRREQRGVEEVA